MPSLEQRKATYQERKGNPELLLKMNLQIVLILCIPTMMCAEAKSIRQASCELPEPPVCGKDTCSEIYYYPSLQSNKCEKCKYCSAGEEPDVPGYTHSCAEQAKGRDVKCRPCKHEHFSRGYDQERCDPCQVSCDNDDRETTVECTATTNRECGDCKPGFFSAYDVCYPCTERTRSEKGCRTLATTAATTPSVSTVSPDTTHVPISKKSSEDIITAHVVPSIDISTAIPHTHVGYIVSKAVVPPGSSHHETTSNLIFRLAVIVGVIVVFALGISYCIYREYSEVKKKGSPRTSFLSSFKSDSISTDDNAETNQDGKKEEIPLSSETSSSPATPSSPDTITSGPVDLDIAANINDLDNVKKQPTKTIETFPSREKLQACPIGKDDASLKSPSKGIPQRQRSMSVPCIIVNPLDGTHDNPRGVLQRISDASSGDDSDYGSPGRPEEETSLLHNHNSNGSSSLAIPPVRKQRRKSSSGPAIRPLCSGGGGFSSGSTEDNFALDSQPASTTSMNNPSQTQIQRNFASLKSQPIRSQQRKQRKIRRLNSYDNHVKVHELNPEVEPNETHSLLLGRSDSQKGPVAHPEQDGRELPALLTYTPLLKQYGAGTDTPNAPTFAKQDEWPTSHDFSNRSPRPPPINSDFPTIPNPIPSVSSISTLPGIQNTINSNAQSSTPGAVTHIYHAPVIHAHGSNVQVAVGNNTNQILQGIPGPGSSRPTEEPQTPEGVECTDPAAMFRTSNEDMAKL